jgi:hypothetical protein
MKRLLLPAIIALIADNNLLIDLNNEQDLLYP